MDTPLYTAPLKHAHRNTYSFHVPGHHNGDVFFDEAKHNGDVFFDEAKSVYQSLLSIDMTEITGLDDLHRNGSHQRSTRFGEQALRLSGKLLSRQWNDCRQPGDDFGCL